MEVISNLKKICIDKNVRNKVLITLLLLAVYRVGSSIPIPGVNTTQFYSSLETNSFFSLLNMIGGGALGNFSIFALGVSPYITASIIVQLLIDVIPQLTEFSKQGEKGRKKIENVMMVLAVFLALIQGYGITRNIDKQYGLLNNPSVAGYLFVSAMLMLGVLLVIGIGKLIDKFGIGDGISLLIFSGIVCNFPYQLRNLVSIIWDGTNRGSVFSSVLYIVLFLLLLFTIIYGILKVDLAQRRVPIQYHKQTTLKNNLTYLPFKLNSASVLPVIFAQTLLTIPTIITSYFNYDLSLKISSWLSISKPFGLILYALLIIMFAFTYTAVQVDTEKISEDMKKNGAFIPNIRQGKDTAKYLSRVLMTVTWFGTIGLLTIAILPYILGMFTKIPSSIGILGTGLIIVVGVALSIHNNIDQLLIDYKYSQFSYSKEKKEKKKRGK